MISKRLEILMKRKKKIVCQIDGSPTTGHRIDPQAAFGNITRVHSAYSIRYIYYRPGCTRVMFPNTTQMETEIAERNGNGII